MLAGVPGARGMMSFLQYSPTLFDTCCEEYGLRLVMDSGAFSKPLSAKDIERYAGVIATLGDRCEWYASADVIADQPRSNQNYKFLLSLLPPQHRSRVLWVYQVTAPLQYLDEGLEQFDHVGIGGLVSLSGHNYEARLLAVAQHIAARKAQVEAHYFGVARLRMIRLLWDIHHDGLFSCDSSTWLCGAKYHRLIRADGRQVPVKNTGFDFTTSEVLAQNVRTMCKWIEPQGVGESKSHALQLSLFS